MYVNVLTYYKLMNFDFVHGKKNKNIFWNLSTFRYVSRDFKISPFGERLKSGRQKMQ